MRYSESLNQALHHLMEIDDKNFVLGEDIIDPYGGAFKITKGLSTAFPKQVFSTPISEAAITGFASGMAIRGYRPIVEIMFGDFITLCADQLVNGASKFNYMYNDKCPVPIVIRTPMGGGRGYGPTHSQSLEKIYFGIPGLKVVAPSHFHNPGQELITATNDNVPVVFIENKLLYPMQLFRKNKLLSIEEIEEHSKYITVIVRNYDKAESSNKSPDLTLITYGGVSRIVEELLIDFVEEEIWIDVILPSLISPINIDSIIESANSTGQVLVVEDGSSEFSWGKEIAYQLQKNVFKNLKKPVECIGAKLSPIPASFKLEQRMLINKIKIEKSIMDIIQ